MNIIVTRAKSSFPRGLGAIPSDITPTAAFAAFSRGSAARPHPIGTPFNPVAAQTPASTATSTSSTSQPISRLRRTKHPSSYQYENWQQTANSALTQTSSTPSAGTLAAFQQALASASALGVISSTDVLNYQAEANNATDAQMQALTAQINSLVASTPSAAAASALTSAATTPATTSWWSGTTSIGGYSIGNTTLVIGGAFVLGLAYVFLGKKR